MLGEPGELLQAEEQAVQEGGGGRVPLPQHDLPNPPQPLPLPPFARRHTTAIHNLDRPRRQHNLVITLAHDNDCLVLHCHCLLFHHRHHLFAFNTLKLLVCVQQARVGARSAYIASCFMPIFAVFVILLNHLASRLRILAWIQGAHEVQKLREVARAKVPYLQVVVSMTVEHIQLRPVFMFHYLAFISSLGYHIVNFIKLSFFWLVIPN